MSVKSNAVSYRVQGLKAELHWKEYRYRFLVVHSTKLDGRKTKSLQKELSRGENELQKAALKKGRTDSMKCFGKDSCCAYFHPSAGFPYIALYFSRTCSMIGTGGMKMPAFFKSGPAALISALYDELRIGQTIDEIVVWDEKQCYLSPGKRIKAIVINIFGHKRPLYRIDEFYKDMDIENLFGRGISLQSLEDYR